VVRALARAVAVAVSAAVARAEVDIVAAEVVEVSSWVWQVLDLAEGCLEAALETSADTKVILAEQEVAGPVALVKVKVKVPSAEEVMGAVAVVVT